MQDRVIACAPQDLRNGDPGAEIITGQIAHIDIGARAEIAVEHPRRVLFIDLHGGCPQEACEARIDGGAVGARPIHGNVHACSSGLAARDDEGFIVEPEAAVFLQNLFGGFEIAIILHHL